MATLSDINNPSFTLLPVNNNRTAWRPFSLPVLLVVPHRRDGLENPLANSNIWGVRVFIEDVPQSAIVAGPQHVGMRFPDRELYAVNLSSVDLGTRQLELQNYMITRNGVQVALVDAQTGDLIHYTTTTGVSDTVPYVQGADYYDLSNVALDVESLPDGKYSFAFECTFYPRLIATGSESDLLCIDASRTAISTFRFAINHPGDIIAEMYRLTPEAYLTSDKKSLDTTVALYRPLADVLQDVMDEQDLLRAVNWVFNIAPEAIPYLGALLGWEIPYFPESLDALRRGVLRRTVEFQSLKGSRRALNALFNLFGFEILISNLWWSSDGLRLIRPGEALPPPYQNEQITIQEQCQIDLLLNAYNTPGFGTFSIPLLLRPQTVAGLDDFLALLEGGNVTIDCYLVDVSSQAYHILAGIAAQITANPLGYAMANGGCLEDRRGFINPTAIHAAMVGQQVIGYSQALISGKAGTVTDIIQTGTEPPLSSVNVTFDRTGNVLSLTLNGYQDFTSSAVFAFATYKQQATIVPPAIAALQSNRFDIQVISQATDDFVDPTTLEFAVEFLFRLKAFHSLLNVIRYRLELGEVYLVTDLCFGGNIQQRFDTGFGRLQVPPAIIPAVPAEISACSQLDPVSLGYRDADLLYRTRVIDGLLDEFAAWQALDGRATALSNLLRLPTPQPAAGRQSCTYTPLGQDRVAVSQAIPVYSTEYGPSPIANQGAGSGSNQQLSPASLDENGVFTPYGSGASSNNDSSQFATFQRLTQAIQAAHCTLDGVTDYCYKGRAQDELLTRAAFIGDETYRARPCQIGFGSGVYWAYPTVSVQTLPGASTYDLFSLSQPPVFSANAPANGITPILSDIQADYLSVDADEPLPDRSNSMLGRLYRNYAVPEGETIHYSDRLSPDVEASHQLALQRPSLDIQKPILHFPGCRFPRLNALLSDFHSTTWRARPWDDAFSEACGPAGLCQPDPTFLHAAIIHGQLVYDDVPFTMYGNGLQPDISSLGQQTVGTLFTASEVVHAVYMHNAADRPAIVFDGAVPFGTQTSNGFIETNAPLFSSESQCAATGPKYVDFADGYPASVGFVLTPLIDITRGGTNLALLHGLGVLQPSSGPITQVNVLFTLGSGILTGNRDIRLDCGCSLASCADTAEPIAVLCSVNSFLDDDGQFDWKPDQVSIIRTMLLDEETGTNTHLLDGSVPSLLETF